MMGKRSKKSNVREDNILECQSEILYFIDVQRMRRIPQEIDGSQELQKEICRRILWKPISEKVGRYPRNPQSTIVEGNSSRILWKEDYEKIIAEKVNVEAWFEKVERHPCNPQFAIVEGRSYCILQKGWLQKYLCGKGKCISLVWKSWKAGPQPATCNCGRKEFPQIAEISLWKVNCGNIVYRKINA